MNLTFKVIQLNKNRGLSWRKLLWLLPQVVWNMERTWTLTSVTDIDSF